MIVAEFGLGSLGSTDFQRQYLNPINIPLDNDGSVICVCFIFKNEKHKHKPRKDSIRLSRRSSFAVDLRRRGAVSRPWRVSSAECDLRGDAGGGLSALGQARCAGS